MSRLRDFIGRLGDSELIGRSRLESAYVGERARCAKVIDQMIQELNRDERWTEADDHRPPASEKAAVILNLQEAARRIRAGTPGPNPRRSR